MKNNNQKTFLIGLLLLTIPNLVWAMNLSFGNPVGTTGTMTVFFEAIITGILNIVAFLGVLFLAIGGIIYLMAASSGNDNLIGTAKKIWTGSLTGLALSLAGPSFLKEIKEIVLGVGGTVPTDIASAPSLTDIVSNSLDFLLSIIGILAIISLVINSILYLTAFGDSSKAEKTKTNIMYSLMGVIAAGSALIIVQEIVLLIET